MLKKVIILFLFVILVSLTSLVLKDILFPYSGEYIASKGVYHKTSCSLLKYSTDNQIRFYPSYQDAIKANNRPCKTCNPQWYTVEEFEQAKKLDEEQKIEAKKVTEEKKVQAEKDKLFEDLVQKKLEERKQQILNGTKKELTTVENKWFENKKNENNPILKKYDGFVEGFDELKKQIEEEVRDELRQ